MNTPSAEHIKAKLRKLLELARQGVGGEKDNAQSILGKMLTKHGLTLMISIQNTPRCVNVNSSSVMHLNANSCCR